VLLRKEKDSENSLTKQEQDLINDLNNAGNDDILAYEKSDITKLETGKPYPIYGMITSIINDNIDDFTVELNYSIKAKLLFSATDNVSALEKKQLIMNRSFEVAIFILEFTKLYDIHTENLDNISHVAEADCHTVIFGRSTHDPENVH
jgi:hypothetical protein